MISWLIFIAALLGIFATVKISPTSLKGRLVSLVAVMLGATIIVSGGLRLVPGDPIDHILGDQARSTSRELLAQDLGILNKNGEAIGFVEQYANFLGQLSKNELKSLITRQNTLSTVLKRLPYTVSLALAAMIVAIVLGPLMGILASLFHQRWQDHLFSLFALIGISIPTFFLAPLLLLLFALTWELLPVSGADDGFSSIVLPAFSLGIALAAMLARIMRASMLEVLSEDYIRTAFAKGLPMRKIFLQHALKNALIPLTTLVGLQFGAILSGTVIAEKIFNWPGIGLLLLESINRLDMPMVQTCVLLIAFMYAAINLLTDYLYTIIDPRITMGEFR